MGSPECTGGAKNSSASDRGVDDGQYSDKKDDVIPETIRKGTLPGTGGAPLLVPWLFALGAASLTVARRDQTTSGQEGRSGT